MSEVNMSVCKYCLNKNDLCWTLFYGGAPDIGLGRLPEGVKVLCCEECRLLMSEDHNAE